MDIIEYIYAEFVNFLTSKGVLENYNQGLLSSKDISVYNKEKLMGIMQDNIIDYSFRWLDVPCPNNEWCDLNREWKLKFSSLFESAKDLTPLTIYCTKDDCIIKIFQNKGYDVELVNFRFSERKIPLDIRGSALVWKYNYNMLINIAYYNIPVKFKEIDKNIVMHVSEVFESALTGITCKINDVIFQIDDKLPLNYIDLDMNTGKVSYLLRNKIKEVPEEEYYTSSKRTQTTIGKLLVKLDSNKILDKCEIEMISNYFRGICQNVTVKVLEGEDIKWAYLEDNYTPENECITSTLHNSCMRHPRCQPFFDFYIAAHAKIAVLLDEEERVAARALLWEVEKDKFYLDRIYSVTPFTNFRFVAAIKTHYNIEYFRIDGRVYNASTYEEIKGGLNNLHYSIQTEELKHYEGYFPYLDTFFIFIKPLGMLCTAEEVRTLRCTDGSSNY